VDLVFDEVARTNDVLYGTAIDKPTGQQVDLLLDIYEPAGDTADRRPVFVFLFGGGFVMGNKELEPRAYCNLMARRGYVSVAISYRLNQGDIYRDGIPAAVADARQAVAWLRQHADEYRLDPDRIVIGGSSAGAITSLFVAYTDWSLEPGEPPSDVAAVLDLWGGLYTEVRQMEAGEPPLAIIHGTEDTVVSFSEAERLRDRAEEVGVPHLFHPLTGEGHAPYMPAELMEVVAPFYFEQLWPDVPPPTVTPTPIPTHTRAPTPTPTATSAPSPTPTEDVHAPVYLPVARRDVG
jgi:acetyl esterase/lipase